jgi:hypothetical protein
MTDYNEGLWDGIISCFTLGYLDAQQVWELLEGNHFDGHEANLMNMHLTDFIDHEKKVEFIIACPNGNVVDDFLEMYEMEYEDDLTTIMEQR